MLHNVWLPRLGVALCDDHHTLVARGAHFVARHDFHTGEMLLEETGEPLARPIVGEGLQPQS